MTVTVQFGASKSEEYGITLESCLHFATITKQLSPICMVTVWRNTRLGSLLIHGTL